MAVLAPPDWYPLTRDSSMDIQPSSNTSAPRQRANDHSSSNHQQQPFQSYPTQQPQGAWTPSISAQPFYPSFYQSHHPHQQQQQYPLLNPQQPQSPYFDPNSAQLAQWAYQQMMFNAQQTYMSPHLASIPNHQQRSPPSSSNDYFTQQQQSAFSPFPSGTPPPPQNYSSSSAHRAEHQNGQPQYNGFHPYRRPNRIPSHATDASDWRPPGPPQPPYRHRDASGSSSSVNSASSHGHNSGGGSRPRTDSAQSTKSGSNGHSSSAPTSGTVRTRNGSQQPQQQQPSSTNGTHVRAGSSNSSSSNQRMIHNRNLSSSSSGSTASPRSSAVSNSPIPAARPARPSPLSQGTFTAAEKRMSRDDSVLDPTPTAAMVRSGGLKGRIRRALSFNAASTLREDDNNDADDDDVSIKASTSKTKSSKSKIFPKSSPAASGSGSVPLSPDAGDATDEGGSPVTPVKKRSRAASLFNSRLNASTDNISLSSTVSSASVMIRKLGKLARRNSLAGITSLFKDKKDKDDLDDNEGGEGSKKGKKNKRSGKGEASEASVSHATAEIDRMGSSNGDWTAGTEMSGLSPAAKLARQHTLKSNAEAAARAKAQQEADAAAAAATASAGTSNAASAAAKMRGGVNGAGTPLTWERNTTTRQASPVKGGGTAKVTEDGTLVLVEDDDSASEDGGSGDEHYGIGDGGSGQHQFPGQKWDDDDEEAGWEEEEEEDVTIRVALERTSIGGDDEEMLAWAMDVRRSIDRTRVPSKGILKDAGAYNQQAYLNGPIPHRTRSNSYNSHPGQHSELGPLARIPSPDPDHIDGLHRHPSHSSSHSHSHSSNAAASSSSGPAPSLPPLSFDLSGGLGLDSPKKSPEPQSPGEQQHPPIHHHPHPEKEKSLFNHPALNSSAPALSTMLLAASGGGPPTLPHRSATAPAKRLTFATNLSVYDTFSATMYDRRSEPATWSRLTPALAQQIKEELNSYKMEEMEVHAASRIHTQFFV